MFPRFTRGTRLCDDAQVQDGDLEDAAQQLEFLTVMQVLYLDRGIGQ